MSINHQLKELEKQGSYIRVGLVGAGQMGRGMISQIESMKGMRVVATADIDKSNALNAYLHAGIDGSDIIQTNNREEAEHAIIDNKVVVTNDSHLILSLDNIDVVVDATGVPNIGAEIAWHSILNKKHVVMLNVETDVTVGPLLRKMALAAGVVYTGSDGDEPGAIMELYHFADTLGFEIVALGKGKNNPLNYAANPDTAREEAVRKGSNPKMLASFQDGTKTMIEMTAVANATGFVPDKIGMHGPTASTEQLTEIFQTVDNNGILSRTKIVDYVNGVAPGVFAIITSNKQEVHHEMQYLKMGTGPNYLLFRPYHLTSLETPLTIAKAFLYNEETIAPWKGLVAETVTVAKRDLSPGEHLDGIGGFTVYGTIMNFAEARDQKALPIGLVHPGLVLKRNISCGDIITYDDVEHSTEEPFIWELRRIQDREIKSKTLGQSHVEYIASNT
jgi:predicted homoserine dehydrogenase-like protein